MAGNEQALAGCIQIYIAAVDSTLGEARQLSPPAAASREHKRFVENLTELQTGLNGVLTGVNASDQEMIDSASAKLNEIFGDSEAASASILEERRADIADFNAKIKKMNELMEQIGQDQVELHEKFDR